MDLVHVRGSDEVMALAGVIHVSSMSSMGPPPWNLPRAAASDRSAPKLAALPGNRITRTVLCCVVR